MTTLIFILQGILGTIVIIGIIIGIVYLWHHFTCKLCKGVYLVRKHRNG